MIENLSGRNAVAFLPAVAFPPAKNNEILAIDISTPIVHKSNQRSGFLCFITVFKMKQITYVRTFCI